MRKLSDTESRKDCEIYILPSGWRGETSADLRRHRLYFNVDLKSSFESSSSKNFLKLSIVSVNGFLAFSSMANNRKTFRIAKEKKSQQRPECDWRKFPESFAHN